MKRLSLAMLALAALSVLALAMSGCVTAIYQTPDGAQVGYTEWFKDVHATSVKATGPGGVTLELNGVQSDTNVQMAQQVTAQLQAAAAISGHPVPAVKP